VIVVHVAMLVVALAAFQPWRLLTSTTVVEAAPLPPTTLASITPASALPVAAPQASVPPALTPGAAAIGPAVLASGAFVSHEHRTTGTARLIRLADDSLVVRLEQLDTSDGPALHVWLTDQPVRSGSAGWHVFDDGRYVDLGVLKGNQGSQNYAIPTGTDLTGLTSVSVWCARFHVSFGAAQLTGPG
jgi:hypothetical protein